MNYVYILRSLNCRDRLYVGCSTNLQQRLNLHNEGCVPFTSKSRPWRLEYFEAHEQKVQAYKRERQLKGWTRQKKEALIAGDCELLRYLSRKKAR